MTTACGFQLTPGAVPVPADVETLRRLCRELRRDLLDLTKHSGTGSNHIGGEVYLAHRALPECRKRKQQLAENATRHLTLNP